jgi:hypothetical protein
MIEDSKHVADWMCPFFLILRPSEYRCTGAVIVNTGFSPRYALFDRADNMHPSSRTRITRMLQQRNPESATHNFDKA